MASRAIGSGTISFGLVSIPIKLYTAASPQRVGFNLLHRKCGSRIKMQYFCPVDNEVVGRDEMLKGYEYAKDQYVQFSDEELKKLEAERTDRLDISEFVPEDTVDFLYIENTYFLGPDKGGDRAYKLLSEAMQRTGRIAVGRFGTRGKEQLVLVRPYRGGLVMHYVYYADEVRSIDDLELPKNVTFRPVEEELADKLIEQLSADAFKASDYRDTYRDRVLEAAQLKVAGQEVVTAVERPEAQVIDLFEALKKSLGQKVEAISEETAPTPRPLKKAAPKRPAREKKPLAG